MGVGGGLNQKKKLDDATRLCNIDCSSILQYKIGLRSYRTEKQARNSALFLMSKVKF
jgi:hypothetical protein